MVERQMARKMGDRMCRLAAVSLTLAAALCAPTSGYAQDKGDYANGDASSGFSAQAYPMSQNGWASNGFTAEERDQLIAAGLPSGDEAVKWMALTAETGRMPPETVGEYYRAGRKYGFDPDDLKAVWNAFLRFHNAHPLWGASSTPDEEEYREAASVHRGGDADRIYEKFSNQTASSRTLSVDPPENPAHNIRTHGIGSVFNDAKGVVAKSCAGDVLEMSEPLENLAARVLSPLPGDGSLDGKCILTSLPAALNLPGGARKIAPHVYFIDPSSWNAQGQFGEMSALTLTDNIEPLPSYSSRAVVKFTADGRVPPNFDVIYLISP